jgi:hypothetical protein
VAQSIAQTLIEAKAKIENPFHWTTGKLARAPKSLWKQKVRDVEHTKLGL